MSETLQSSRLAAIESLQRERTALAQQENYAETSAGARSLKEIDAEIMILKGQQSINEYEFNPVIENWDGTRG